MIDWQSAKILFKYPSRTRPEKFFQGLDSIVNNLNHPNKNVVVCSFDMDDDTMNQEWVKEKLTTYPIPIVIHRGVSKNKIDAVNRDLSHLHDCKIIVCMSDDMRFIQEGFDLSIRNDFATHFPDGDGCLHYPDQHQGEKCMTLNITDSIYYNRFGYIYNPEYVSVECDLENQEVAKMLGRYKFVEKRIFNHLHPSFGDTEYDNQYRKTEDFSVHEADKATRKRRKANNYDLLWLTDHWESVTKEQESELEKSSKVHMTFPKHEPMTEISITDVLVRQHENTLKTMKLRDKFNKKLEQLKADAAEINALGIVKIEVSVTEESLK